jgi:type II secretory pathway component PulF|tara:strand:+ start:7814 stop:8032 length:219 start_codon:yes stop_codon:yes gene_type:complete
MMSNLEFKKHGERYEINLSHSKNTKSYYRNIVDKDPNKLAQILIDLHLEGYPIEKAVKIMRERMTKKDWLGL